MKICVLKCMHLSRVASQCKHSHHDITSQQLHIHETFTTFAKCIFNSFLDIRRSYPRLVWTLNQWMTTFSSFIDQLIGFEMMEAFVSAIQTVISLDSPFEQERNFFSKITRIYNLAHKLLGLRSKRLGWWKKAFISLPSHLQRNIPC